MKHNYNNNNNKERIFIDNKKLVSFNYETLKYCILSKTMTEELIGIKKIGFINKMIMKKDLKYLNANGFFNSVNIGNVDIPGYDYLHLTIMATNKCNLNCKHCLLGKYTSPNFIDVDLVQMFLHKYNIMEINFTGGEFFQHPNYKELIEIAEEKGIIYSVYSNGVDLPKDIENILESKQLYDFQISVESHDPDIHDSIRGKNTLHKVEASMKLLKNYANKITIATTVSEFNFEICDDLINYFYKKFNITKFKFSNLIAEGNARDNDLPTISLARFNSLVDKLKMMFPELKINDDQLSDYTNGEYDFEKNMYRKTISCHALNFHITLTPQGTIIPCTYFYNETQSKGISIDSLIENNSNQLDEMFEDFKKAKQLKNSKECIECEVREICNINCPYVVVSNNFDKDVLCIKRNNDYLNQKNVVDMYNNLVNELIRSKKIKLSPSINFVDYNGQFFSHDYVKNIINIDIGIVEFTPSEIKRILTHELEHYVQSQELNIEKIYAYIKKKLPKSLRHNASIILNVTLDVLSKNTFNITTNNDINSAMRKTELKELARNRYIYFLILMLTKRNDYLSSKLTIRSVFAIADSLINDFLDFALLSENISSK